MPKIFNLKNYHLLYLSQNFMAMTFLGNDQIKLCMQKLYNAIYNSHIILLWLKLICSWNKNVWDIIQK